MASDTPPITVRGLEAEISRIDDNVHELEGTIAVLDKVADDITTDLEECAGPDAAALRNKPWWVLTNSMLSLRVWTPIQHMLVLYAVLFIPVFICFEHTVNVDNSTSLTNLTLVMDIMFLFDLCLNFTISYRDSNDQLVTNPRKIRNHYLRGWFILDFIASVPPVVLKLYDVAGGETAKFGRVARVGRIMRLLRLSRVAKVTKIGSVVDSMQAHFRLNAGAMRLTKTLCLLLLLTHLVGCIFHGIATWEQASDSWDAARNLRCNSEAIMDDGTILPCRNGFTIRYLNSLYWAFTTLTTVGYGDISATTEMEIGFSIVTMILGVTIYSLILSSVNSAMSAFDTNSAFVARERRRVDDFARAAKLPRPLASRCGKYVHHRITHASEIKMPEAERDAVLQMLSPTLRAEVVKYIYRDRIAAIPFLFCVRGGNVKDDGFMCQVIPRLQIHRVFDKVTLCLERAAVHDVLFLAQGFVRVYREDKFIGRIEGGLRDSHFGFLAALRKGQFRTTVTTEDEVVYYTMPAKDLRQIFATLDRGMAGSIRSMAGSKEARVLLRASIRKVIHAYRLTGVISLPGKGKVHPFEHTEHAGHGIGGHHSTDKGSLALKALNKRINLLEGHITTASKNVTKILHHLMMTRSAHSHDQIEGHGIEA
eukprot:g3407.t1